MNTRNFSAIVGLMRWVGAEALSQHWFCPIEFKLSNNFDINYKGLKQAHHRRWVSLHLNLHFSLRRVHPLGCESLIGLLIFLYYFEYRIYPITPRNWWIVMSICLLRYSKSQGWFILHWVLGRILKLLLFSIYSRGYS